MPVTLVIAGRGSLGRPRIQIMGRVLIGTSGYSYDHWRGRFYPQGLSKRNWLSFYARQFETVEINASFYRNFRREVFAKLDPRCWMLHEKE